jgi:TorA maturation chaperone TorD
MREGGIDEAIRSGRSVGTQPESSGRSQPVAPERLASPFDSAPPDAVRSAGDPRASADAQASVSARDPHASADAQASVEDDVDLLRAHEYGLLALLFGRAPTAEVLARVAELRGDASPLGLAHIHLAEAAAARDAASVSREFFDLFVGVARGELLPYASYYLTGYLHERPLARVREDLARLGIERVEEQREPEDHIAILCEVMAGLCAGRFEAEPGADRAFFERHLQPWAARFFADCETSRHGRFYRAAGAVGRMFMEIEAQAFAMEA